MRLLLLLLLLLCIVLLESRKSESRGTSGARGKPCGIFGTVLGCKVPGTRPSIVPRPVIVPKPGPTIWINRRKPPGTGIFPWPKPRPTRRPTQKGIPVVYSGDHHLPFPEPRSPTDGKLVGSAEGFLEGKAYYLTEMYEFYAAKKYLPFDPQRPTQCSRNMTKANSTTLVTNATMNALSDHHTFAWACPADTMCCRWACCWKLYYYPPQRPATPITTRRPNKPGPIGSVIKNLLKSSSTAFAWSSIALCILLAIILQQQ